MANLRKIKNTYYCRVRQWVDGVLKEKTISLKTTNEKEATARRLIVENYEKDIKNGIVKEYQFEKLFPWLNKDGSKEYKLATIDDIIVDYEKYRNTLEIKPSTIKRDISAIETFRWFYKDKPLEAVNNKTIEEFKRHRLDAGMSTGGINIDLRHLRTFFNWLLESDIINKSLKFKQYKKIKVENHISPKLMNEIQGSSISKYYKECLLFHQLTGCRPKEAYMGEIDGNWYKIKAENTKTYIDREFFLTDSLKDIAQTIIDERNRYINRMNLSFEEAVHRLYTRTREAFNRAKAELKVDSSKKLSLYSYRHTYGIVRVLETQNIYQVAMEMGHEDINTTYKNYTRIKPSIIERDFPIFLNNFGMDNQGQKRIISRVTPSPLYEKLLSAPYPNKN